MTRLERTETLWFCAGACLGMAIGVLYAPVSGADARRSLFTKADDAIDALGTSSMVEKTREIYHRGRELADEAAAMVDDGRRLMEPDAG